MADKPKNTFPTIPAKQWWQLRAKFKQSIPTAVSPSYLATALSMTEASAKTNVLPSLLMLGLIDDQNKPTELSRRWRDDESYAAVCNELMKSAYPAELVEAAPPPKPDRRAIVRWFANRTGFGESAATRMAVVYEILANAEPTGANGKESARRPASSKPVVSRKHRAASAPSQAKVDQPASQSVAAHTTPVQNSGRGPAVPEIHVNVQIHIAADATADQIDQIFASMGKHLVKLNTNDRGTQEG